jgi:dihydrofolate reductase
MAKVRLQMTMSLDGYVAGPRQRLEHPLGEGGTALHRWAFATRSFRASHGMEGGEAGPDDAYAMAWRDNVGATIMGRNMFGPVRGDWGEGAWRGWWGDEPPYHTPVFVLTHHPREPLDMLGGTTFHFVTGGIEAALARAADAAAGLDVMIGGGARTAQQYLRAGLVDEMQVHVAPLLLGAGERLFEDVGSALAPFECVALESSSAVAHFTWRRVGPAPAPAGRDGADR